MIEEKGPWAAAFGNGKAFIESDDFTHDVRLCVSGDFESVEQKVEYAEEIARRLNTFASYDAEIAELKQRFYAKGFEAGRQAGVVEVAELIEIMAQRIKVWKALNDR